MIRICCECRKLIGFQQPWTDLSITSGLCGWCFYTKMLEIEERRWQRNIDSVFETTGHKPTLGAQKSLCKRPELDCWCIDMSKKLSGCILLTFAEASNRLRSVWYGYGTKLVKLLNK